jgi:glycine cleavage system transcriptional repressor
MEQLMVVSAVGGEPTAVVQELTRVIMDCGGNIKESRMVVLGSEFAMLLLVAGNWHTISRMERELNRFASSNAVTMQLKRTEARRFGKELLPYAVDVVGLDQPGVVHSLSGFFAARKVEIAEVSTRSYAATHTGAPMFSVYMLVNIPGSVHISGLREEFMDFCDQLNVDAIMEPVKQS